jgi:hypothetical protein
MWHIKFLYSMHLRWSKLVLLYSAVQCLHLHIFYRRCLISLKQNFQVIFNYQRKYIEKVCKSNSRFELYFYFFISLTIRKLPYLETEDSEVKVVQQFFSQIALIHYALNFRTITLRGCRGAQAIGENMNSPRRSHSNWTERLVPDGRKIRGKKKKLSWPPPPPNTTYHAVPTGYCTFETPDTFFFVWDKVYEK